MEAADAAEPVGLELQYPPGSTPLDPDEREGLIPGHIETQGELNAWEADNILRGDEWAFRKKRSDLLTDSFVRQLHQRMFDDTWTWAGTYRKSGKNIGALPYEIPVRVRNALEDTSYSVEHQTFPLDIIAVRLHHRLVAVHPFRNGNGRHTRMMADLLMSNHEKSRFSWGGGDLVETGQLRSQYIGALKAADDGDIEPLLQFARSDT
jgi:Fic-DOC domain mobile mystery protein B